MSLNYHLLGMRIQERRNALSISQLEFAEMLDLSTSFVSRLECGNRGISLETLMLIASVLDTTPDYLLQDSLPIRIGEKEEFSSCTAYERYVLKHILPALVQALRDGEHIRNQTK